MRVPALIALAVLAVLAALFAVPPVGGAGSGGAVTADRVAQTPNEPTNTTGNDTVNATVSRARGALFDDLTSVDALREARERGDLVRSYLRVDDRGARPAFVPGDVLVVRVESERLAAALRARNGPTPTERYLDYVNRTAARLQLVQTPWTTTPERRRQRIAVNESRIRVLAENDTRWVLLDTGNATARYGTSGPAYDDIHGGREFGVWFDFSATAGGLPAVDGRPRVAAVHPSVEFGTGPGRDELYLSPTANATVRVSSALAPGTAVAVRAHLPDETVERRVVVRGRNRTTATARFDLSGYAERRTFRLTAVRRGETVGVVTGLVDTPKATLRLGERDPWDAVIPVTANLSRGGTVVLQSPNGSVVYDSATVDPYANSTRTLYLPAPDLRNRTVFSVVAYRSFDADPVAGEDVAYREDGSPVEVTGVYDPEARPTASPTASPTATLAAVSTDSAVPTRTPTVRPATETDARDGSSPVTDADGTGFGLLATALAVALTASGAVLRGRFR